MTSFLDNHSQPGEFDRPGNRSQRRLLKHRFIPAEGTGLEPATPFGAPDFESGCSPIRIPSNVRRTLNRYWKAFRSNPSQGRDYSKRKAGVLGFEPRLTDPESVVLPLHHTPVRKGTFVAP